METRLLPVSGDPQGSAMSKSGYRIVIVAPLLLAACKQYQTPEGPILGTAPPLVWTIPVGPQQGPATAPPLGTPLDEPPPAADLSGSYRGTAVVTYNRGRSVRCDDRRISGFNVSGRQARFFGFRGTISPTGEVVMQSSDRWISGRFVGRSFYGQLWSRYPACTWNLSLTAG